MSHGYTARPEDGAGPVTTAVRVALERGGRVLKIQNFRAPWT